MTNSGHKTGHAAEYIGKSVVLPEYSAAKSAANHHRADRAHLTRCGASGTFASLWTLCYSHCPIAGWSSW